jgi:hypothetical protein
MSSPETGPIDGHASQGPREYLEGCAGPLSSWRFADCFACQRLLDGLSSRFGRVLLELLLVLDRLAAVISAKSSGRSKRYVVEWYHGRAVSQGILGARRSLSLISYNGSKINVSITSFCVCYEKIGMPIADLKGESYDIFRNEGRKS